MEEALGPAFFGAIDNTLQQAIPLRVTCEPVCISQQVSLPVANLDAFFKALHTTNIGDIEKLCISRLTPPIPGYTFESFSLVDLTTDLPTNLFLNLNDHYDLFIIYLLYPLLWPILAFEWFRYRMLKKKGTLDVTVHCVMTLEASPGATLETPPT